MGRRPRSSGRVRYGATLDATLRHLDHRPPQDRDHRLDRGPDRDRHHRRLGRLRLHRRIQAARPPIRQEAFDLLENRFPAQSGDTATIVFKADGGRRVAGGAHRRWRASSPRRKRSRTSAKSPAPTTRAAARRDQQGRQDRLRDRPVRRLHRQARKRRHQEARSATAEAAGGSGLQVELGGRRSRKCGPKKKATPRS